MHCDALTAQNAFFGQVSFENLKSSGNILQCFAVFTKDCSAAAYAAARNLYYGEVVKSGFCSVKNYDEFKSARVRGLNCCALTAENIGFTYGDGKKISQLKADGLIMASLVWNYENTLAYPNVRADGKREQRGLKKEGRQALSFLDENKIIVDISHLSDGGAYEILIGRKIPVVASHSNCAAVCKNPRNLTDGILKKIADCGGAVGINFYKKFLGRGDAYFQIAQHIRHIIKVAGEDAPALGSDWDGVPEGGQTLSPEDMQSLFSRLTDYGLPPRVIDKLAYENFLRVFKEVC